MIKDCFTGGKAIIVGRVIAGRGGWGEKGLEGSSGVIWSRCYVLEGEQPCTTKVNPLKGYFRRVNSLKGYFIKVNPLKGYFIKVNSS